MKQKNAIAQLIIEDSRTLSEFFLSVTGAKAVGLDTEFMRVKTYFPELCLLQIALRDGSAACIDPVKIHRSALRHALSDCSTTIVAHSAGQDLEVLHTCLDFLPSTLFDTQIAAALLGYGDQMSYHGLVKTLTGVDLEKGETRTDWCQRPLTNAQIEYAFADVDHLLDLSDTLGEKLEQEGKYDWFASACAELVQRQRQDGEQRLVERFKGGRNVRISRQAMLRDLLLWREQVARTCNRPREWIVSSADLIALAEKAPDSINALSSCTSMHQTQAKRHGNDILQIIAAASDSASDEIIWPPQVELLPEQKTRLKALQKKLREVCAERSISPSVVASRADLEAWITGRPGRLDSGWRRLAIGSILDDTG